MNNWSRRSFLGSALYGLSAHALAGIAPKSSKADAVVNPGPARGGDAATFAEIASVGNFTGPLHRQTSEVLAQFESRSSGGNVEIASFSIALRWDPFASVQEAAAGEHTIQWFKQSSGDVRRQEACTLSFAGLELRRYLAQMSKVVGPSSLQFKSISENPKGNLFVVESLTSDGALPLFRKYISPALLEDLRGGAERFAVVPANIEGRVVILLLGSDRVGALYAVYSFLEKLGARWLGLGEENEHIPALERFQLQEGYVEKPGFGLRGFWGMRKNRGTEPLFSWMAKNRLNVWGADNLLPGMRKRGIKLVGGEHWVQEEAGFDGNICQSIPGKLERFVSNVVNLLVDGIYKDVDILEYLPLDWGIRCEADASLGSPTDRDLNIVHHLRQAVHAAYQEGRIDRDVSIFTLAYFDTVSPPTHPMPSNFDYQHTSVGFYPQRCFAHALNDPTCNEAWVAYEKRPGGEYAISQPNNEQLSAYLNLWCGGATPYKGRVGFGDYYERAILYNLPIPLMNLMAKDYPYLRELGVWDVRYMHVATSSWATKTLTNYQFAKMLWNPNLDVPALLADYFYTRYGPIARPMSDFYFHLERAMSNIMFLKLQFTDRFNRIVMMKENLFIWQHLQLDASHPMLNCGVSLTESIEELLTCRQILDATLRLSVPSRIHQRIVEDKEWFEYASNTIHFYYYMARTYIRKTEGDIDGARKEFGDAQRVGQLLREQHLPILISGVHQPNQADELEATGLMPAYAWFKDNLVSNEKKGNRL